MRFFTQCTVLVITTITAIVLIKEKLKHVGYAILFFNAGYVLGKLEEYVEERLD